jgi:putative cell wall-binding protein
MMAIEGKATFRYLLVALAALLCWAALGTSAFAAPGDSIANATPLHDYFGSSLTTRLAGAIGGTGSYWFRVQLSAGETLRANFIASSAVVNMQALVLPLTSGYDLVESTAVSSRIARLTFMAPVDGMYNLYVGTSTQGTFTVQPALLGPAYADPPAQRDVARISGPDRYATAVALSQASFPGTATTVVIATGVNYADALAGSGLCGSYDSPLLLVGPNDLPSTVLAEVDRLKPSTVFVLGSAGAVSDSVVAALRAPSREVTRVAGNNRYETAVAIGDRIKAHELSLNHAFVNQAFVVNGLNYPDALSASPLAFSRKMPILLVTPTSLPPATKTAATSLGITQSYIIGGTSAVSDTVKNQLPGTKTRIWGYDSHGNSNRLLTSNAVATYAVGQHWATFGTVGLTTGWNYPDALGGGVYCGKQGGLLLLTQPLYMDDPTMVCVFDHRASISKMRIFGATGAVAGFVFGTGDLIMAAD